MSRGAHNALFAVLFALVAAWTTHAWTTGALALFAVHLHIAGDVMGSRGPDDYAWPIAYFAPFADTQFVWAGQWRLNAWPNMVITIALMTLTIAWARRRGDSIVGLVSRRADAAFLKALRSSHPPPARNRDLRGD